MSRRNLLSFLVLFAALLLPFSSASAFGPCVEKIPNDVAYSPSLKECGNRAAIILAGRYYNSFSAVVRDCNNNDRDPCNKGETSCGTNRSSPFKVQRKLVGTGLFTRSNKIKKIRIHCLREAGTSEVYKLVRRMTIKLKNPVRSPADVAKLCLKTRTLEINPVEVVTAKVERFSPNAGSTAVCATQGYLDCDISYEAICAQG